MKSNQPDGSLQQKKENVQKQINGTASHIACSPPIFVSPAKRDFSLFFASRRAVSCRHRQLIHDCLPFPDAEAVLFSF